MPRLPAILWILVIMSVALPCAATSPHRLRRVLPPASNQTEATPANASLADPWPAQASRINVRGRVLLMIQGLEIHAIARYEREKGSLHLLQICKTFACNELVELDTLSVVASL
jgi:hypothetical protein